MRILQLCCFTNLFGDEFQVDSWDIKNGKNVFHLNSVQGYDFVISAPVCTQFTKVNSQNWLDYPRYEIDLARHCFKLSVQSGLNWILENPPGRIERFIPDLSQYRRITYQDRDYNKEYVLYSNMMLLDQCKVRYGKKALPRRKIDREAWTPGLIEMVKMNLK